MDIIFGNNRIRKKCRNPQGRLKRLLDDIQAADHFGVLMTIPGHCHPLTGDRKGQWALRLEHPKRLVFEPVFEPLQISEDDRLDMENITAVKLMEVVDYHG